MYPSNHEGALPKLRHFLVTGFQPLVADPKREGHQIVDVHPYLNVPKYDNHVYTVAGHEVCPDTGTVHVHIFFAFANPRSPEAFRAAFAHLKAHVRFISMTPSKAVSYCKKDGYFVESGVMPLFSVRERSLKGGQANKDHWREFNSLAKSGELLEIEEKFPEKFVPHFHSIQRVGRHFRPKPADLPSFCRWPCSDAAHTLFCPTPPPNLWIWGSPGVGKSFSARNHCGYVGSDIFEKDFSSFWANYDNEPLVYLEDLSPDHAYLIDHLKRWCDQYAFRGGEKHLQAVMLRPQRIVVTSNFSIDQVFASKDMVSLEALKQRFVVFHKLSKSDRPPEYPPVHVVPDQLSGDEADFSDLS